MSFLSAIVSSAGCSSSMISTTVAPSLMLLMKNGPMQAATMLQQPMMRGVSHLSGSSSGQGSSAGSKAQPGKTGDSPSFRRPFIPRGTAATHLRSFAAQPALAEDNQMFCVSSTVHAVVHAAATTTNCIGSASRLTDSTNTDSTNPHGADAKGWC